MRFCERTSCSIVFYSRYRIANTGDTWIYRSLLFSTSRHSILYKSPVNLGPKAVEKKTLEDQLLRYRASLQSWQPHWVELLEIEDHWRLKDLLPRGGVVAGGLNSRAPVARSWERLQEELSCWFCWDERNQLLATCFRVGVSPSFVHVWLKRQSA